MGFGGNFFFTYSHVFVCFCHAQPPASFPTLQTEHDTTKTTFCTQVPATLGTTALNIIRPLQRNGEQRAKRQKLDYGWIWQSLWNFPLTELPFWPTWGQLECFQDQELRMSPRWHAAGAAFGGRFGMYWEAKLDRLPPAAWITCLLWKCDNTERWKRKGGNI